MGEKETLISKLPLFKKVVGKKIVLEKMVLFGSYAHGLIHKDSDVDLLLVSSNFNNTKFAQRSPFLYKLWHMDLNMQKPVDFICYTPEEYDKLKKKVSLASQALKEGIEIL